MNPELEPQAAIDDALIADEPASASAADTPVAAPRQSPAPALATVGDPGREARIRRGLRSLMLLGLPMAVATITSCVTPAPFPPATTTPGWPTTTTPTTMPTTTPTTTPPGGMALARYQVGSPTVTEIWLDPTGGDDGRSGADRSHALRTMEAAWRRVPTETAVAPTGARIRITPGTVPIHSLPNNWYEAKHGTRQKPIMIEAADGRGTVTIEGGMNVLDVSYLYLTGLRFTAGGAAPAVTDTVVHGEKIDHLLIRQSDLIGDRGPEANMKEGLKVNQSRNVFVEDSDISGGWDNPVDYVAVQQGHAIANKIHDGGDWCMYVKGGSANIVVDANELAGCGTGGFTAGQGTGFEWMTAPYLTYEAMGIEFTNNVIHDVEGAGFGTNGGFNVLFAYNTVFRAGTRSHLVEVLHGNRNCDGEIAICRANNAAGGWGPNGAGEDTQFIPSRHVSIMNNIFVNPPGVLAPQQFTVASPTTPPPGWNVGSPAVVDHDLRIAGNVIWNGGADTPVGIEDSGACMPSNPTCNLTQLRRDNAFNTTDPRLVDPAHGDFRPATAITGRAAALPAVVWSDAPARPDTRSLPWVRSDAASHTRAGTARSLPGTPGAL